MGYLHFLISQSPIPPLPVMGVVHGANSYITIWHRQLQAFSALVG